jgi:S-DNA-T family DNA segregation ATPase FtsK/SpoIIIE
MRSSSARNSRAGASRRSRPARTVKRARGKAKPLLTPRQAREVVGVLLLLFGLLGVIALLFSSGGSALAGLREFWSISFGLAWPLPVGLALAIGGYLLLPSPPAVRRLDLAAGLLAALAVIGLLDLAAGAGGRAGRSVDAFLTGLAGPLGAAILMAAGLLLGLIVVFHFSVASMLATAASVARTGYEERKRLQALVKPKVSVPAVAEPKAAPVKPHVEPTPEPEPVFEVDAWAEEDAEPVAAAPAPPPPPVMRVVAEPEDDEPEIDWKLPPLTLLDTVTARKERMQDEIKRNVRVIESTLATFGVQARVIGVNPGPAVTQYELQPAAGVQVKRITTLQNDLSLALAAAPLRIEAPIPGKSAVGIEVPNKSASLVTIREVLESPNFRTGALSLALSVGNDVSGQAIVGDLTRMPHLLIAGATGQGKSVFVNVLIASLLFQSTPERLRLILIDPKRVELSGYNNLPHLAVPVIVEPGHAAAALRWAVAEMDRRYKLLSAEGVRNVQGYNERAAAKNARPLPFVVIVIDELADLMMVAAGEIEELVCRIAQLARAVGIHLVIATQSPRTDIITGLIKANIPSRIAFAVPSQIDSRVILDSPGAEKLLGRGDMLYQPVDAGKPIRIQGAFISDQETEALVRFWRTQGEPRFIEEVLEAGSVGEWEGGEGSQRKLDPLFARAARAVAAEGAASVSLVQRKFNVGYSRAGRIVDQLADHRVVGGYQGSKSREVLMNLPDVDELLERIGLE